MLHSLSPYMLLKRSKPTPPAVYTTAYDLYSAAAQDSSNASMQETSRPSPAPIPSSLPFVPARTHYINSIQSRHNLAARAARMNPVSSL